MHEGSEYEAPSTPFICAGDRAKLEMDLDLLRSALIKIRAWDDEIPLVGLLQQRSLASTLLCAGRTQILCL